MLGQRVRKYRKQKKYTLEKFAEKIEVSTTFMGQIERATGKPSLETLVNIANALEVSADALLFGELNEKSSQSYFLKKVEEMTDSFTSKEKELVLKNIEILKTFKSEC